MPTILIAGAPRAGKTSLAYALLVRLRDAGRSAAYCKPFSTTPDANADHLFVSEVLAEALGVAVGPPPVPLFDNVAEAISTIAELRRQHDTVVVEVAGGAPTEGLASAADARVLEVSAYAPGQDWARVADEAAVRWGNRLAALVVNGVPAYQREAVAASAVESSADVDAVVIPESRVMLAPTVAQIGEQLDAVWTLEPVNADALVERFLIGGNIMDNGPTYYGRYNNQAVITRTQRPDIQLASMLPQTRCLVLTGPGEPAEYIKAEARERYIPLLQVSTSTIDTADALDRLMGAATAHSLAKVQHYAALLEQHAGEEWLTGVTG